MLTDEERNKLRDIEATLRVKVSGHPNMRPAKDERYKYKFVGSKKIQHSGVHPVYRPTEDGGRVDA